MFTRMNWRELLRIIGLTFGLTAGYFAVIILLSVGIAWALGLQSGLPRLGEMLETSNVLLLLFVPSTPFIIILIFVAHADELKDFLDASLMVSVFPCTHTTILFTLGGADFFVSLIPLGIMVLAFIVELFRHPWRQSLLWLAGGTAFACVAAWGRSQPAVVVVLGAHGLADRLHRRSRAMGASTCLCRQ